MPHLEAVTIHSRHPAALARFWSAGSTARPSTADAAASDQGTLPPSEAVLLGSRDGLHVWVSPADDLAAPGGRVHLDIRFDTAAELARLGDLGAVWQWDDPEGRWSVYADPEGNLFCAVPPGRDQ